MKRRVLIAGVAALAGLNAFGAAAADPFSQPATDEAQLRAALARPAARLLPAQILKGRFRHSKYLSEIPRPLIATGEFTFVRELGVYWHTQQPFDSIVVLTATGMVQSDEGEPAVRVSADEQPAVKVIANIFMALFTLDVASLSRDFNLYGGDLADSRRAGGWIIGLKPRATAIAGVFKQATVAGADDVEQVVLTDARGDRTVIELTGITYSSDPPGAGERALFAPARP